MKQVRFITRVYGTSYQCFLNCLTHTFWELVIFSWTSSDESEFVLLRSEVVKLELSSSSA